MERKFSFDDMSFTARSERAGGKLRVGIFDAYGERIHMAEHSARKGKGKAAQPAAPLDEEAALSALIEDFKRKVESGDIDLA